MALIRRSIGLNSKNDSKMEVSKARNGELLASIQGLGRIITKLGLEYKYMKTETNMKVAGSMV